MNRRAKSSEARTQGVLHVERPGRELDLVPGGDPVVDTSGELCRQRSAGAAHGLSVGIEGQHPGGVRGDADGQTPVAATEFEHVSSAEVRKPVERAEVSLLRVEDSARTRFPQYYPFLA